MVVETKKSLGQHWLNDRTSLQAMCQAAQVSESDTVLEVGPGQGSLTKQLLARGTHVVAVELDSTLAANLLKNLPHYISNLCKVRPCKGGLEVVEGDILKFDLTALPAGYKVVANIPYYLTGNLLKILCESPNPPSKMALLVQKEVAQRLAAGPGQMSLLAVSVQLFYEVEIGTVVPARLFNPPPKVDSQVVALSRRQKPLFDSLDSKLFFRIVKAGFSGKRKKLRGSLSAGLNISKEQVDQLLLQAGINGNLRAQNLSLVDWHKIYSVPALPQNT